MPQLALGGLAGSLPLWVVLLSEGLRFTRDIQREVGSHCPALPDISCPALPVLSCPEPVCHCADCPAPAEVTSQVFDWTVGAAGGAAVVGIAASATCRRDGRAREGVVAPRRRGGGVLA